MMRHWAIAAAILASVAALPAGAQTYGDTLVASIAAHHPGVTGIRIDATGKDGKPIRVVWGTPGQPASSAPLRTALGDVIGTIAVTARAPIDAEPIAWQAARRIYVADNLAEADPFVARAVRSRRGQALIDALIDANPDLVTLAMHVALPGADNIIIASSFGRIGKLADKDDADVIASGTIRREVTNGGHRLAVELPMLDARRRVIGALSTSFAMTGPDDEAHAFARAVAVRDALARRTPSLAALAGQ
ncbi:MAG TPA: hypothetical protein VF485_08505 [Sphingomonas sp.]